jgi:hypothetical protein
VIPAKEFKGRRPPVLVLNDAAGKIAESNRGVDEDSVMPHRPVQPKNNIAFQMQETRDRATLLRVVNG